MPVAIENPFEMSSVEQHVTETPLPAVAGADLPKGAAAQRRELERLYATSPTYAQREKHWRFMAKSYEGGPQYVGADTLFRHEREHKDSYEMRLARAHYWNYSAPLNDFVPEHIYREPIQRVGEGDIKSAFETFKADVDRSGTGIDQFMRRVAEESRLYGLVWIGIDKPVKPNQPVVTKLDEDRLKLRPYWYLVRRAEVLDFEVDKFGTYIYLKRLVSSRTRSGDTWKLLDEVIEWTQVDVKVTVVDVTDAKKKRLVRRTLTNHDYGFVPFQPVFYRRSKFNYDEGVSFLEDIAYQNRQVFNMTSLLDEFLYRQCFNILAMEQNTGIPERAGTEGEVGTANALEIPRGATHFPAYLSPPTQPAEFIQSERDAVIREMYRQAVQDVANEMFGSGEAQRQSMGRSIPNIARMADDLQAVEIKALSMWAKLAGYAEFTGKVAYRDDYSVTTLMDMVLQLSGIFNNLRVLPPTFVKEEWKRVIREFDGRIEPEKMLTIEREIDALTDEDILGRYAVPGDTQAQEAMPSAGNMIQGRMQQQTGTDKKRSLATGDSASTKEGVRDANHRTSQPTGRG